MTKKKAFIPIVALFTALTAFFVVGKSLLAKWEADQTVLLLGNLVLFIITILSFIMATKDLYTKNPHAVVRSVYGAIMIKLFLCVIAAFIYIAIYQKELNKPAFFTLMGLYLVYTFVEVKTLMRLLKTKTNG